MRKLIWAFCVAAFASAFPALPSPASAAERTPDPVSAVQGTWQSMADDAEPGGFRLTGEKLRFDDGSELYVIIGQRDGRALARIAGLDEIVWVATVVDKDRIDCYFPLKGKLIAYERMTGMPVEDLYGMWKVRDPSGDDDFEEDFRIGAGFVEMAGGRREKVEIENRAGIFRLIPLDRKNDPLILTPKDADRLEARVEGREEKIFILTRMPDKAEPAPGSHKVMGENAKTAISALKAYATAQVTFQVGRQGREKTNSGAGARGYADNFRNLFYGTPSGNKKVNMQLISKAMADAFAGPGAGIATVDMVAKPETTAVPWHGYLFLEPPGVDYAKEFALVAYPAKFNQTGAAIFWIDMTGTIKRLIPEQLKGKIPADGDGPRLVTEADIPKNAPELWVDE